LKHCNRERKESANKYFDSLENTGDIQLPPKENKTEKPVYHQFVIQTKYRDKLKKYLGQHGIETAIHYPTPIHLQKPYAQLGYRKGSVPIAEKLSKTILSLPIFPGLKESEVGRISSSIKNFFK